MERARIEGRILAALQCERRPLCVADLRGPGMPGLTSRSPAQIRAACEALVERGELVRIRSWERRGKPVVEYALPPVDLRKAIS